MFSKLCGGIGGHLYLVGLIFIWSVKLDLGLFKQSLSDTRIWRYSLIYMEDIINSGLGLIRSDDFNLLVSGWMDGWMD